LEYHYKIIEHFGGTHSFKKLTKNDKIKKEFCKNNNISYNVVKYNENIDEKIIDILK